MARRPTRRHCAQYGATLSRSLGVASRKMPRVSHLLLLGKAFMALHPSYSWIVSPEAKMALDGCCCQSSQYVLGKYKVTVVRRHRKDIPIGIPVGTRYTTSVVAVGAYGCVLDLLSSRQKVLHFLVEMRGKNVCM